MKIFKKHVFFFLALCASFWLTKQLNFDLTHHVIRVTIFPVLIFIYLKKEANTNTFLLLFLISFALAELIYFYVFLAQTIELMPYLLCNTLYILGYLFVITHILSNLNLGLLVKRFPIQLVILIALSTYLVFELNSIVIYNKSNTLFIIGYFQDLIYNFFMVITLSLSLLNYFYHDSKSAIKLLIACTTLVFSEFFQTVYYYENIPESLKIVVDKMYAVLLAISYFTFCIYIMNLKSKPLKTKKA